MCSEGQVSNFRTQLNLNGSQRNIEGRTRTRRIELEHAEGTVRGDERRESRMA
jgi:hypothetical protein